MADNQKDPFKENDNIYKNDISFEQDALNKENIEQIEVITDEPKENVQKEPESKAEKPSEPERKESKPVAPVKKPIKPKVKKTAAPAKKKVATKPKKTVKKTTKKRVVKKKKKQSSAWPTIILIIIVLAAIGIAIYMNVSLTPEETTEPADETGTVDTTTPTSIAVSVNGETITEAELQKKYDSLPSVVKQTYSKELLLDQLINETLLIQKAKEEGIIVTAEEAEQDLLVLLQQNGITKEQFEQNIVLQGLTYEDFLEVQTNRLLISRLFDATIFNDVEITDEEVAQYYEENQDLFMTEEEVSVRHILIGVTPERDDETAKALADEIVQKIEDGEDYCDLVVEYSEDPGSATLEKCGAYTFVQNVMVPEFEETSFRLEAGEIEVTKTDFGYHIIEKLESTPAKQSPVEEVADQIKETIISEKGDARLQVMIDELRSEATIVYGETSETDTMTEPEYMEVPEDETTIIITDEDVEQVLEDQGHLEEDTVDTMEETETEVIEVEEPEEDVMEESEETMEESEPEQPPVMIDATELATCLTENDVVMYGIFWSKSVKEQKEVFGDAFSSITYVECDPNGPNADIDACATADISLYPTWIMGDESAAGFQELEALANFASC